MARIPLWFVVIALTWIVLVLISATGSGAGYYSDPDLWPYPKSPYLQQYAWDSEINFFLNSYGETYYPSAAYTQYSYSLPAIFGYGTVGNTSTPVFASAYYPSIAHGLGA
ncbi:MAG: hypothetical protein EHM14_04775 [Methanothrix sp.]|nr:MAG: hypothetical protein EHM14_04775 [Methanothrix sp.]